MTCSKTPSKDAVTRLRTMIADLFAKGHSKAAASHRLAQCPHASDCGKMCQWMVKQQGLLGLFCTHPDNPREDESLYVLVEDPSWPCPGGRF